MAEVWKVCRVEDDGAFRSAFATRVRHGDDMDLEYPLHEEVSALEGTVGIVGFSTQARAQSWATHCSDGRYDAVVLRCTTRFAPKLIGVLLSFYRPDLWCSGKQLLLSAPMSWSSTLCDEIIPAPLGSITVPSLTPVECVWERRLV